MLFLSINHQWQQTQGAQKRDGQKKVLGKNVREFGQRCKLLADAGVDNNVRDNAHGGCPDEGGEGNQR